MGMTGGEPLDVGPWTVRAFGRSALLVDSGEVEPASLNKAFVTARGDRGDEVITGAATVLIVIGRNQQPQSALEVLESLVPEAVSAFGEGGPGAEVEIPVRYDGADLDTVADLVGMSTDEVVAMHGEAIYRAAFMGFAPGFAYLTGLPAPLVVGRRSRPRPVVPAGSVAIAEGYSAVYPRSTPGGWHLLGTTETLLFDPGRMPAALITAGSRVRFVRIGSQIRRRQPELLVRGGGPNLQLPSSLASAVEVVDGGTLTTFQDEGRPGHASEGVPPSGAADSVNADLANRLVGNAESAAVLETTMAGPKLLFGAGLGRPRTVAVTGAMGPVTVDGVGRANNAPFDVGPGQMLAVGSPRHGLRAYIAVSGGFDGAVVLGSRSTDLLSGLGPPVLAAGQLLALGPDPGRRPGVDVAPVRSAGTPALIRVSPGPRADWVTAGGRHRMMSEPWVVTTSSNRVGVRLTGPALDRARGGELPPEGLLTGAIQVTPADELVVFLRDHPVTGGYPVVAVVDEADLGVVAQLRPGERVFFR